MEQFDNTFLLNLLRKNYKHLFIVLIVSGLVSAVISSSLFITPKFKSVAVLYPSNVAPYSNESQTEQMVQLFQSADIRDRIIDSLDLFKHYDIDMNHSQKKSVINAEFADNVSISKTEFESIEIMVLDKDPAIAAKVIEAFIYFADKKIQNIQKAKALEVVNLNKNLFHSIKIEIDSIDSLVKTYGRQYGLLDYGAQTVESQKAYYKGLLKNNSKTQIESKAMLNNLVEHGYDFMFLTDKAANLRNIYNSQATEYYKSIREYRKTFTYNNIVSKPVASDKKAYPVRWIIVAMSMLSALFLAFLVLLVTSKNNSDNI